MAYFWASFSIYPPGAPLQFTCESDHPSISSPFWLSSLRKLIMFVYRKLSTPIETGPNISFEPFLRDQGRLNRCSLIKDAIYGARKGYVRFAEK
jgi:hypothetical protein